MGPEAGSATPATSFAAPGGPAGCPFRGPGVLTRVAPFAVVAALAEASLALPPGPQSAAAAIVSVLLLLAVPAAFLLPWPRLPDWATVFVPLLYTGSALALILAAGATSGVGIVILIPVVWTALFHQRWESGCVVAAVVAVEVTISLTPVAAADSVIVRRALLWALLGTLVSVATHGLRDRISRSQAERERLQDRLRELSVMEDRDRIATELRGNVIQRIFAAGLTLQGAVELTAEAHARRRIETSIGELDEVVRMLREAVFALEHRPRHSGLRQQVLGLCGGLSPVPEIGFSGQVDKALSEEAQAQLLDLLRETFDLIEPEAVPGRVEVTVNADACLVVIDAASREHHAEETDPEQDFSGLLSRATQAGARIDIQTSLSGIRFSCQLPLIAPPRPVAADPARDLSGG
jgi:signal transduction histidine kinase